MTKIDESKLITFVVCEGEAYQLKNLPAHAETFCNQDRWLCDWIFVGAYTPAEAVKVASVVDEKCNFKTSRIYTKFLSMKEQQQKLFNEERSFSPAEILKSVKHETNLIFRQGWVTV